MTSASQVRGRIDPRLKQAEGELRRFALSYPDAWEDTPWGERAAKVGKKVFAFGYGLARSGWVSSHFGPGQRPPTEVLKQWIDESYRAVAPRKLLRRLEPEPRARSRRRALTLRCAPQDRAG